MRVIVVAEGSGGLLGPEVAAQVADGWARQAPHDQLLAVGLSDGGEGFLGALVPALGLEVTPVLVTGPDGAPVPAEIALRQEGAPAGTDGATACTAYLEAAQACGRHLVSHGRLTDPGGLSSHGVGELLRAARHAGATRVVLGVGDLASHDGGRGLLKALGAGPDLAGLPAIVHQWQGIELVLVASTGLVLLGFHGASAALGTEHDVSAGTTQRLESELGQFTAQVASVLPPPTDLLTQRPMRPERLPSSGVGGGVGYAVGLLGAGAVTGARWVLEELDLLDRLPGALVVAVTDSYDWRTVHDGVVAETARAALDAAAPTVVLAAQALVGRREGMALGVSGSYGAREGEGFADLAARVARTWSPPMRRG